MSLDELQVGQSAGPEVSVAPRSEQAPGVDQGELRALLGRMKEFLDNIE